MTVSRAPMQAAEPGRQSEQQRQAWPEKAMSVDAAAAVLGERAERDVSLAPFTTYRLGGPAALLVRARSVDDLAAVAAARAASGLPVVVVGRGSNLLVADEGFAGIAVLATALGWRPASSAPGVGNGRTSSADRVWRCPSSLAASRQRVGVASSGPWGCPARSAEPCG